MSTLLHLPNHGSQRPWGGTLTAAQWVLKVHRHVAQEVTVDDVPPLDGVHTAEDRVVAEAHSTLQYFCTRKKVVSKHAVSLNSHKYGGISLYFEFC